jgi:phage shock protein A
MERIMGIFSRVKDIGLSNVHAALDAVEDPAKTVRLVIRETEDELVRLRRAASMAASESRALEIGINAASAEIAQLEEQARAAVVSGRDNLARLAVRNKLALTGRLGSMQAEFQAARRSHALAQTACSELEGVLSDARVRERAVSRRLDAPAAQVGSRRGRDKLEQSFTRLNLAERMLSDLEADLDIPGTAMRSELRDLQVEAEIEEAMKRMRAPTLGASD